MYSLPLSHIFGIATFLYLICLVASQTQDESTNSGKMCQPLRPIENVKLTCTHQNTTADCQNKQLVGTEAKYECHPYYIPYDGKSDTVIGNVMKCGQDGTWSNLQKFLTFRCAENCGKRLVNPKPLVVYGKATNRTSWPWHAAIFKRNPRTGEYICICGGTIIRNGVILTAAHCVSAGTTGIADNPSSFKIVLGTFSSNYSHNTEALGAQTFSVQNIFISTNYDAKKDYQADIAIMHLSGRIDFNDYAIPVCLPNDYAVDINAVKPGRFGDIVGFGVDETGNPSPVLKHGALQIMSNTECYNRLKQTLRHENFITVCNGDSGGGLVYPAASLRKYYIHGIVSTGGVRTGSVCENYGVFTRVFQFIFWIRDTLEQINGDVIRELSENVKTNFILRGKFSDGKIIRNTFSGVPREWDNRVNVMELTYVDFDPSQLLRSLEYTSTLESLNLTQVKFDGSITERVRLPYLKSFVLDLLAEDFTIFNAKFPFSLTKDYIKSLIFFDKDYEEHPTTWNVEHITHLRTNIELTIDIFKLININYDEGKVILSQIPFSAEIIENAPVNSKFDLKYLGLSRSKINIEKLLKIKDSLQTLIIDNIKIPAEILPNEIFNKLVNLEELRITWSRINYYSEEKSSQEINLVELSHKLKFLALQDGVLNYGPTPACRSSTFPQLETFVCFTCNMDKKVLQNFHLTFKNIRTLILGTRERINIKRLMDRMDNLETIYLTHGDERFKNFLGLQNITGYENFQHLDTIVLHKNKNNGDEWTIQSRIGWWELPYQSMGLANFWTSRLDYVLERRLSPYELISYETNHYKFNGSTGDPNRLQPWNFIPENLARGLKSVDISHAEVIPDVLFQSLRHSDNLESLKLSHVKLFGTFEDRLKNLIELKEFKLSRIISSPQASIRGTEFLERLDKKIFNSLIPFLESEDKISYQPSSFIDFASSEIYLNSSLMNFDITYDECKIFSMNKNEGELISTVEFTPEILQNLVGVQLKYPIKKLALTRILLHPLSNYIPTTVTHLNIQNADQKDVNDMRTILPNLKSLKELRLRPVTPETPIDLSDLEPSSSTIEYLDFDRIKFTSNRTEGGEIVFKKLKMASFEFCDFDDKIVDKFSTIFPAKRLSLLLAQFNPGDATTQEKILAHVLSEVNTNIEWVYSAIYPFEYDDNDDEEPRVKSETTLYMERKLEEAGVPIKDVYYFIIEKINGKWTWVKRTTDIPRKNDMEFHFPADKWSGRNNFGDNPDCQGKIKVTYEEED